MKTETYPRRINYTLMEDGARKRNPVGVVMECPSCGKNGLRQVYSWRKKRYKVGYHHVAIQMAPGDTPIVKEQCSYFSPSLKEMSKVERERGG